MTLAKEAKKFHNKKLLIIGDLLLDKYIFGTADKLSPDAPVPSITINETHNYLGGAGMVLKYIKSLSGIPYTYNIVGNDYDGDQIIKKLQKLKVNTSGILVSENVNTPYITRIKALNQQLLRLESHYATIPKQTINDFLHLVESAPSDIESIMILDYGLNGLFNDNFITKLLSTLNNSFENTPIIVRPNESKYYLYEGVDLMKINLFKALRIFSINCYNTTSALITGKKILNTCKSKNLLLSHLELDSYLFSLDNEHIKKYRPKLKNFIYNYISTGSAIMAVLGLSYASNIPVTVGVDLALRASALSATKSDNFFFNLEEFIKSLD